MRINKNNSYTKLRRKAFFQILTLIAAAAGIICLLRQLTLGKVADFFVYLFVRYLHMDYSNALSVYQFGIRSNMAVILPGAAFILALLFLWFFLGQFTRYFDEISASMDHLLDGSDAPIQLSPEMEFMETRLNTINAQLRQQKKAVREAEQRKNDLAAYLAHDIRTPLTSVIGYLNLLDELPDMPPGQRAHYTHITLEKAYRLEKLVNEFFEITRYNIQQIKLSKENIDLYYMLVQLTDEFYPILSGRENTVSLHMDENLTVCGDPDKLARVFGNLLKNAIAYGYPHSDISISAREENGFVIISFQNQGPAIPEEKLSTIFEKFYRLDEARATETGGTGLGLSIAKEIILLHDGTITADSKDNTITFTITLPVSNEKN